MNLNLKQNRCVLLAALCLAAFIASACYSAQHAANRQPGEAQTQATPQMPAKATAQPVVKTTALPAQAAPALKKADLTYDDRVAWRKVLNWPGDCEQSFEATTEKNLAGLRFFELAPQQYLVEVMCARGAYQGEQRFMFYDQTQTPPVAQLLSFKTYEAPDEKFESLKLQETPEIWGLAEFNPQTNELTILNKFRGVGDCGSWARYGFEQGRPQLREFRAQLACNGRGARDPQKWRKVN